LISLIAFLCPVNSVKCQCKLKKRLAFRLYFVTSLLDQAEHVLSFLDHHKIEKAHFVGHSVGGAVATLLAIHYPQRVNSLVSVEGNMTPADAFWSANLAKKPLEEIQALLDSYGDDVPAWIAGSGVSETSETIRIASDWLSNQPAKTLKAQARAVVEATSQHSNYLSALSKLLSEGLDLHLLAGSRSREQWHVPRNIEAKAKSVTLLPERGHLMMLESPAEFAETILDLIA